MDVKLDNKLNPLRRSLNGNLWNVINQNPMKNFDFQKFLTSVLHQTQRQITPNDYHFIENYAEKLQGTYKETMRNINNRIPHGNILREKKEISAKVKNEFTGLVKEFLNDYDER